MRPPTVSKPRRHPELTRLYAAAFLGVLIFVLFRVYRVLSTQVAAGIDAPSRWALLAVGLLNTVAIGALLFIVARSLAKLYFERRKGILGSRIRTRLVLALFSVCFLPSLLLFLVGRNFISKNIRRWFLPETQELIRDGDMLSRAYQREIEGSLASVLKALQQKDGVSDVVRHELELGLLARCEKAGRHDLKLSLHESWSGPEYTAFWSTQCEQLMNSHQNRLEVDRPEGRWLLAYDGSSWIVGRLIPKSQMDALIRLERRKLEHSQIQDYREGLETLPQSVFLLLTLMAIFFAVWVGLTIARTISEPVRSLAKAARRVGQGDFDVVVPVHGEDELALLGNSFNTMIQDVKKSRSAMEAQAERLERQRAYLGQLLEALPVGVMSWHPDGELRTFNKTARTWLNCPQESADTAWEILCRDSRLGGLPELLSHVKTRQEPKEEELRLGGEGEGRPVRAMVLPLREGGELAVLEDLSLLAHAEKRAAWQEVARRMAHEVKNPLTPIKLTAQRLLRRCREGRVELQTVSEGAQTILVEVEGLARLVDSFSRFAKLPLPQPKAMDPKELMHQLVALYAPSHPDVQIELSLPDESLEVNWDFDMVKRALINFVDNALCAMDNQGTLRLALELQGADVLLSVADEGNGIPENLRERLFQPYFSTKRKGTGLGLAISKRIAQDHGGDAHFEPLSPGSKFTIRLPQKLMLDQISNP